MQKWKKGRGRSDYAGPMIPKMKNSNRERERDYWIPLQQKHTCGRALHTSARRSEVLEERENAASFQIEERKKVWMEGLLNWCLELGKRLRFDTLIKKQNCNMYLPDLDWKPARNCFLGRNLKRKRKEKLNKNNLSDSDGNINVWMTAIEPSE